MWGSCARAHARRRPAGWGRGRVSAGVGLAAWPGCRVPGWGERRLRDPARRRRAAIECPGFAAREGRLSARAVAQFELVDLEVDDVGAGGAVRFAVGHL